MNNSQVPWLDAKVLTNLLSKAVCGCLVLMHKIYSHEMCRLVFAMCCLLKAIQPLGELLELCQMQVVIHNERPLTGMMQTMKLHSMLASSFGLAVPDLPASFSALKRILGDTKFGRSAYIPEHCMSKIISVLGWRQHNLIWKKMSKKKEESEAGI